MESLIGVRRKFSIRFTVGSLFLFATVITACCAISMQYYFGYKLAQEHVLSKLAMSSSEVSSHLQEVENNASGGVQILRGVSMYTRDQFTESETQSIFAQILKDNPLFYSLYFGRKDEDFFQIINLESSPIVRQKINAEEGDRWVVIKIYGEGKERVRATRYLNEHFGLTKTIIEPSDYFPTQRPWFVGAKDDRVFKTDPYLFQHLKIIGQTYSIQSQKGAIGIDIVLSSVNDKIDAQHLGLGDVSGVESYVFNNRGEVLASNIDLYTDRQKFVEGEEWNGATLPHEELLALTQIPSHHDSMTRLQLNGEAKFVYVNKLTSSHEGSGEYFAVVVPERVISDKVLPELLQSVIATASLMLCLLPIAWKFGSPIVNPIRALRKETQKIKARQYEKVGLVDTRIKEVSELSISIAEMGAELQRHEKQQEEFVESFIKLIAQAIDDKSPYTAGHCNRVPELGLLLARAAEESTSGEFKDFYFANDDERREFRIAAWLHDCGKITTPEHIVDKGSKLEANYNRIHEIRMRFEVLLRDAEIEYLKAVQRGEDKQLTSERLDAKKAQLMNDFEFIANANVGGEFMGEEQVERVKQIAAQTWIRHFDDSLGLSPEEELVKVTEEYHLPVSEKLLSDKPEHIVKRSRPIEFNPEHGIKMDVPEYEQNLGEVYNLTISRGTLTAEDRFRINEHMTSGIKMLEALPFPPELAKVPRYATTHHETLKGTGYPRKLSAEDLSIPERILVVADIFEALTAADRPYKKAKPISIAVDILHKMALDNHIDMELFKLFLESGVYLEYANAYLPQSQIDHVDISKYLG